MAELTSSAIVSGPARIVRGALTFYTAGDVEIRMVKETVPVDSVAHGVIDHLFTSEHIEIRCTPEPRWNAAIIAGLWPYLSESDYRIGSNIFHKTTPVSTVVHGIDGEQYTFTDTAITKMPDIALGIGEALLGEVIITAVRDRTKAWNVADAFYTYSGSAGDYDDDTWAATDIRGQRYRGAWATVTGWTEFDVSEGFKVAFDLGLGEVRPNAYGLTRMHLRSVNCEITCTPVGVSSANYQAAVKNQGTSGCLPGERVSTNGKDLTISGADAIPYVKMVKANLTGGGFLFASDKHRLGPVSWRCGRTSTGGTLDDLVVLSAT